jgi:carbon storage regulator CsrA
MLVLSRQQDQTIIFPNLGIRVEVLRVKGKNVSLGIEAPRAIRVSRGELADPDDPQCSSEIIQALEGRIDATLSTQQRHELKNQLNSASLALHAAERKLEQGAAADVERYLAKAVEALGQLNRLSDAFATADSVGGACDASGTDRWEAKSVNADRRKLLIVEDNPNERELLSGVLEAAGYEVVGVEDGQAALEYMESNGCPDIILMDMNMPRLNGQQTINKIRSEMRENDLPIFGVSGLTQAEADLQLGESAVTGWFSKPVNPNQLVKYLHQQLDAIAS